MVPSAMAEAVTELGAKPAAVIAPLAMAEVVMAAGASLAEVTAPAARLLLVTTPLGRVAAVIAKGADVSRWSGDNSAKPLVPSLNQIRKRTSELVKMAGFTGCVSESPSTTVNRPRVTRLVIA